MASDNPIQPRPLRLVGSPSSTSATGFTLPVEAPASCDELFSDFLADGCSHPEYKTFEALIPRIPVLTPRGRVLGPAAWTNIWDFIDDAINGTGGFSDGGYLFPHTREFDREANQLDDKFYARRLSSPYDNFVKPIAETPWNYISQSRDAVVTKVADGADASINKRLLDFWGDSDGRGTSVLDAFEYVAGQARRFGTGWVVVDRPSEPLMNRAQDQATAVYMYCVPTKDVLYWEFDEDYRLAGVIWREPWAEAVPGDAAGPPFDLRIWTKDAWAVYRAMDEKSARHPSEDWSCIDAGDNALGEVPVVQVFDEDPGPGRGFGRTIIPSIAKIAMTCYNIDSEIREIQRNTGFPFLAVPMKDARQVKELTVGAENILGFDGTSGEPRWVTQDLAEAKALADDKEQKKTAAYAMSHMAAIIGYVQTSSGFHTEAEFDKTNRRIGKFAASLETGLTRVSRLVCRYAGMTDEAAIRGTYTITFPRDFGMHNLKELLENLVSRLDMVLGVEDATEAIFDYYCAKYPREPHDDLRKRAEASAQARYKATGGGPPGTRLAVADVTGASGGGTPPAPGQGGNTREWAKALVAKAMGGNVTPMPKGEGGPPPPTPKGKNIPAKPPSGSAGAKPGEIVKGVK